MKSFEQNNEVVSEGFINFVMHEQLVAYSQIHLQNNATLLEAAGKLLEEIESESDINRKKKLADNFIKIGNMLYKEGLYNKEKFNKITEHWNNDGLINEESYGY